MPNKNTGKNFEKLVEILSKLRGPNGCPWDKEQTFKDINPYMLEEVHEVMESIDAGDMQGLKEELGDLLMHVVFHAQMAKEEDIFTIDDVLKGICDKLVYRHPHVFDGAKVKDTNEVLNRWEALKKKEKKGKSILSGVPKNLPALLKAFRLGEKAGRVGFDWDDFDGILGKLHEELQELNEAKNSGEEAAVEHEYGDILFALANIGRHLRINPEEALRKASNRFIHRFKTMEKTAEGKGLDISKLNPEEWDRLWEDAKKRIHEEK